MKHVMQKYADGIPSRLKCVKVVHSLLRNGEFDFIGEPYLLQTRFTKPILPGQTIQTDMWKEGKRIHFTCKVSTSKVPLIRTH